MPANIVLGLQWGDEGKGKLVDVLAPGHQWICRFQGGPNAGHTLVIHGRKFVLHQVPSGIFHAHCRCVVGNGVVLNPITLQDELRQLAEAHIAAAERLYISRRTHLILPSHVLLDAASETQKGERKIGSTLRGISPCYQDKYARTGLRVGDLLLPSFQPRLEALLRLHQSQLDWMCGPGTHDARQGLDGFLEACGALKRHIQIVDAEILLGEALRRGETVLVEGAQGALLDIDFGAYPYVTSSHTLAGGAPVGLGVAPQHMQNVVGVFKAYCTRVGNGPFPTELEGPAADELRRAGNEFGSTTGRPRRVGWLDIPALRYAILLNGITYLSIMKVDVLAGMPRIQICTHYTRGAETLHYLPADSEEGLVPHYVALPGWEPFAADAPLPAALEAFLAFLEQRLETPIRYVSMGPGREAIQERAATVAAPALARQ